MTKAIQHELAPCLPDKRGQEASAAREVPRVVELVVDHASNRPPFTLDVPSMPTRRPSCAAWCSWCFPTADSIPIPKSGELDYLRRVVATLHLPRQLLDELVQKSSGPRPVRQPRSSKLQRALARLELSDSSDSLAIRTAYRRMMLRHRPDRAGSGKKTRQEIVEILRAARPELAREFGIGRLALFGSCARGDAVQGGDADVLVELDPPSGCASWI
jgi:hypothetical protein